MNVPSPSDHYALSAYRSTAIPAQPPHKWSQDADRRSLTRTPLRWGHYAHLEPWQDIDAQLQPSMRNFLDGKGEDDLYINHKHWKFDNSNKWIILFPYFKWWSILIIPWFLWFVAITTSSILTIKSLNPGANSDWIVALMLIPGVIFLAMIVLSMYYTSDSNFKIKKYLIQTSCGLGSALIASILTFIISDYDQDLLWLCAAMPFSVFMGLVGWDYLQDLYLRVIAYDGSGLNRQTGMLTIGRFLRKPFSAPLYEFDATLEFRPAPHGNSGFVIWLHHRYCDVQVALGGKLQSLGMNLEESLAFWDSLQRYMDVTQPLPDLPLLEQFRHLDPTTAAHDKQQGRPSRRWRDMTYRAWERRGRAEVMARNRDYQWQQQPCILQAKIDPSLNIETYYRCQEAKGIEATLKGDDFDNTHRG